MGRTSIAQQTLSANTAFVKRYSNSPKQETVIVLLFSCFASTTHSLSLTDKNAVFHIVVPLPVFFSLIPFMFFSLTQ